MFFETCKVWFLRVVGYVFVTLFEGLDSDVSSLRRRIWLA